MRLTYRTSEVHPAATGGGIGSVAHVFTDMYSPLTFAFCEMADGSSFWLNRTEGGDVASINFMFMMQPPDPWLQAVASIPAGARLGCLRGIPQPGTQGGAA